jgi:hypothetical protein
VKRATDTLLLPAAGYLLLTLLVFAPVLPQFSTALPGGPVADVDAWQNVWNLWWFHQALASLQNPFYTSYLYHPYGTGLYLQTLNASNGLLALPVTALLGPVAGYNAALIVAFALSGLGAYLLALRVSGSRVTAFVGGAIFAFSPFHLTKAWDGQLEQIALQWTAFYALFLLLAAEDLRRRDALLAGVFLALIGYTSWYYLLFFAVYTALFALIWLAAARSWALRRALLVQLVITGVFGALLLLPILVPSLRDIAGGAVSAEVEAGAPGQPGGAVRGAEEAGESLDLVLIHSANLYDFFLPSGLHPLWGGWVAEQVRAWHPYIAAWNVALGYTAVALACVALSVGRGQGSGRAEGGRPASDERPGTGNRKAGARPVGRSQRPVVSGRWSPPGSRAWPWALIGFAALLLALGPQLQIGGTRTGVPLPYALLSVLPGVDIARRPSHFVVITTLMLAPLGALGVRALLGWVSPARRPLILAAVCALLAAEYLPPAWPLLRSEPHPYYARLRGESGALLDLPPRQESPASLEAQIVHGLPILGGYVSRLPVYTFADEAPGVRQLWRGAPDESPLLVTGPDDGLVALGAYSVRHVVVHWDALPGRRRGSMEAALAQALPGVAPVYADERLSAYVVPEAARRPFAYFGDGWNEREREGERHWRWMRAEGRIILVNPTDSPLPVALHLAAQAVEGTREARVTLGDTPLGSWSVGQEVTARGFRLLLEPGEHVLTLCAPATTAPGDGRKLSIVLVAAELR